MCSVAWSLDGQVAVLHPARPTQTEPEIVLKHPRGYEAIGFQAPPPRRRPRGWAPSTERLRIERGEGSCSVSATAKKCITGVK
jgi:hypothetical protein